MSIYVWSLLKVEFLSEVCALLNEAERKHGYNDRVKSKRHLLDYKRSGRHIFFHWHPMSMDMDNCPSTPQQIL